MEDGRLMREEKRLIVQLIPKPLWGMAGREAVGKYKWDNIRKEIYRMADYRCEVCGGKGHQHSVEAHELYLFENRKITCVGVIALCPQCHRSVHPGRCNCLGRDVYLQARENLAKVNNISIDAAQHYYEECFVEWRELSKITQWEMDFSWLDKFYEDLDNG